MSSSDVLESSASSRAPLTVVSVEVPREAVDALIEALAAREICASSWDNIENPQSRLSVFLPPYDVADKEVDVLTAESVGCALVDVGRALGLDLHPAVATLPHTHTHCIRTAATHWRHFVATLPISPGP